MEQLGAAVPAFREVEQLRRFIKEIRGIGTIRKTRMLQQVLEESNIGLHAADTEFLQAPQHLGSRNCMVQAPGGSLNQQGIVIRGNDRTGESVARVQPDAHAAAAAVGNKLAGIRHKVVYRVFRGNTALDRLAPDPNLFLGRNIYFRTVQTVPFRNLNLGLDNINTRNRFRNGMFHLDTGVYFNKVEFVISGDQKFYRARADVADILHQLHSRIADPLPQFRLYKGGRRHFHNFLMAALYGAVTLIQMYDLALFVAQNLNFDMLWVF